MITRNVNKSQFLRYFILDNLGKSNELVFLDCACSVTKKNSGQRLVIKNLIKELNKILKEQNLNVLICMKNGLKKIFNKNFIVIF